MKRIILLILLLVDYQFASAQRVLTSWSQQNIENYTKEMYDEVQKKTAIELLNKNITDSYWSEVFLTLNASVNNYSKDSNYLKGLANQIIDRKETKLKGVSRLIIWDRIISGDIVFEGKGLVVDNDLFKVCGRANQILQNLTNKNFGPVTINCTDKGLKDLQNKWLDYLSDKPVEECQENNLNAKIPEISSLNAVQALVLSLQNNPAKEELTRNCLKKIYHLDEMPKEKGSQASYCSPDTYTFSYLGILFGEQKFDESKDAKWWQRFWEANHNQLVWNKEKGVYQVSR